MERRRRRRRRRSAEAEAAGRRRSGGGGEGRGRQESCGEGAPAVHATDGHRDRAAAVRPALPARQNGCTGAGAVGMGLASSSAGRNTDDGMPPSTLLESKGERGREGERERERKEKEYKWLVVPERGK